MSDTSFSIWLAYKRGWIAAKSNIKMALLAACVWMVIGHVNFFQFLISSHTGAILSRTGAIGFRIIGFLVSSFLSIGLLRMCFDMYDRRAINLNTLFSGADLFVLFVVAAIFYLGIVGGGFLLLIVPGVIWGVKYSFYDLCLIDTGCSSLQAIKESGKITHGSLTKLFFFCLTNGLVMLASFGLLRPVIELARVHVYRQLRG